MNNTAIGFLGLGICSVTSLIIAHQYKVTPIQPLSAPPAAIVSTPTPSSTPVISVGESIKRLKAAGYKGCAILITTGNKGSPFYVCAMEESDGKINPHFYYHDKDRASTNSFPRVKRVKKTSSSPWEYQLFFEKHGDKTVRSNYFPFWFRNLKDEAGNLEKACKITKGVGDSTPTLTLNCNGSDVQRGIQM